MNDHVDKDKDNIKEKSILFSIKKLLGISDFDDSFNVDVIIHINSTLSILRQLGVGKSTNFRVTGLSETWDDFLEEQFKDDRQMVISYVYLKVKLLFDPPSNSFAIEAINKNIAEMEWRLSITTDEIKGDDSHEKSFNPSRNKRPEMGGTPIPKRRW